MPVKYALCYGESFMRVTRVCVLIKCVYLTYNSPSLSSTPQHYAEL